MAVIRYVKSLLREQGLKKLHYDLLRNFFVKTCTCVVFFLTLADAKDRAGARGADYSIDLCVKSLSQLFFNNIYTQRIVKVCLYDSLRVACAL